MAPLQFFIEDRRDRVPVCPEAVIYQMLALSLNVASGGIFALHVDHFFLQMQRLSSVLFHVEAVFPQETGNRASLRCAH